MDEGIEPRGTVLGELTADELREWHWLHSVVEAHEACRGRGDGAGPGPLAAALYERRKLHQRIHRRLCLARLQEWAVFEPTGVVVSEGRTGEDRE